MEEVKRDFKGVWVPKEIWLSKELTPLEKIFLVEIDSLDNGENGCWASNKHFQESFGIEKSNATKIIKKLEEKGWVKVELEYEGNVIKKRIIHVLKPPYPIKDGYGKNYNTPMVKITTGYGKKCKERITIENNIYINIIEYLNTKAKKNFKHNIKKTRSLIDARLNEGYTIDDFKKVIDTKVSQWLEDETMNKYLRPETLFSNKFESYLNEEKITKKDYRKSEVLID